MMPLRNFIRRRRGDGSQAETSGYVVPALAGESVLPPKGGTTYQSLLIRNFALLALLAFRPEVAQACAVCFGKSDSALAKGMNMGIFTLLICILGVLAGLSTFFVYLAVRSSKHPHRDALEASPDSPDNPAHS